MVLLEGKSWKLEMVDSSVVVDMAVLFARNPSKTVRLGIGHIRGLTWPLNGTSGHYHKDKQNLLTRSKYR